MTSRQKKVGAIASVVALLVGIALMVYGHGRISVLFFLAAGIGASIFGPPVDSSGGSGASDAN